MTIFLCACNIHVISLRDYFACILVCFNILHVAICVRDVIIVDVCRQDRKFLHYVNFGGRKLLD